MRKSNKRLSFNYFINDKERRFFFTLLNERKRVDIDATSILSLLSFFNNDVNRLLIALKIGDASSNNIFTVRFINSVYTYLKDSIVLANILSYRNNDKIEVSSMANNNNFQQAGINRSYIYKVIKEYNILKKLKNFE